MPSQFSGKICVVTGATQGVGEAVARHFTKEGAQGIILAGRNTERGQAIEAELCEQGTKAKFITTQLESEKDCQWFNH